MPPSDLVTRDESKLDFLGLARLRFKRAAEAERAQRDAILEAKKFRAGDQWPEAVRVQRSGGQALQGVAAQPARPCLTIDRISAPVRQVSNTVRAANFSIDVHPNGYGADDETARILKGLLRQIQNDARGEDPIEWAADGAAEGGLGWFRLYADYCYDDPNASPETLFDQDLKLGRIANNLSVYCDPSAVQPTRCDARYMFVTEDMAREEFVKKYGKAKLSELDEFRSVGDADRWVGDDLVRIAEYWTCDYDTVKAYLNPQTGEVSIGTGEPDGYDSTWRSRVIYQPHVRMTKITAVHRLENNEWPGTRIPLFPVLGEELNVDGQMCLRGVIQPAQDAQRMVNYLYSGAVESSGLMSKPKWIVAAGQIENYKTFWQMSNTTNLGYLVYDPISIAGTAVPPPQIQQAEPAIQAQVELLHISEEAIKATTNIYDPSLGNTNPREKSGRAILALQQQAEHANSNYVDNVQRALVDCGTELVRLCPIFYDRPGRVLKIAGIDDEPEQVVLGPPPPQQIPPMAGGQPQMGGGISQPGAGMGGGMAPPQPGAGAGIPPSSGAPSQLAAGVKGFYDLSKGNYSVTVTVGKSYATKRQEAIGDIQDLLKVLPPQMAAPIVPFVVKAMDFPGKDDVYDMLIKSLPPQLQPQQGEGPNVQQMQAQLGQASQMVQMLSQELNAKNQLIETDGVKAQYKLQETQLEQETRLKIAEIQAAAQLAAVDAKVNAENARSFVEAMETKIAQAFDAHMAKREQLRDHAHEAAMQAVEMAHQKSLAQQQGVMDLAGQAVDQAHETGMQAAQQAHESDQAQQAQDAAMQQAQTTQPPQKV